MPNDAGHGFVDYVLWGDDGKPLALVEAKRTRSDPRAGQQQAKLYADCLETQYGQRPVIFYTNGYEHWIWDDTPFPPRPIQGFYKSDELALMIQRRTSRKPLAAAVDRQRIVERPYQHRAIRRVCEAFERDGERKALLVMATGAGKTRTVIALVDLLMRAGWVKRVLFLADRIGAGEAGRERSRRICRDRRRQPRDRQGAGRPRLPLDLSDHDEPDRRGRRGERRFGAGHFDLIVIDEAHRSVYRSTTRSSTISTPPGRPDRDAEGRGRPQHLPPLRPRSRRADRRLFARRSGARRLPGAAACRLASPPNFSIAASRYDELTDEEKEEWDALEWDEDGAVPDSVEAPRSTNGCSTRTPSTGCSPT